MFVSVLHWSRMVFMVYGFLDILISRNMEKEMM